MADFTFEAAPMYKQYVNRIKSIEKTILGILILCFIGCVLGAAKRGDFDLKTIVIITFCLWILIVLILIYTERNLITKLIVENEMVIIDEYHFNTFKNYRGKLSDFIIEKRFKKSRSGGNYYLYIKYVNENTVVKQSFEFGWTEAVVDDLVTTLNGPKTESIH